MELRPEAISSAATVSAAASATIASETKVPPAQDDASSTMASLDASLFSGSSGSCRRLFNTAVFYGCWTDGSVQTHQCPMSHGPVVPTDSSHVLSSGILLTASIRLVIQKTHSMRTRSEQSLHLASLDRWRNRERTGAVLGVETGGNQFCRNCFCGCFGYRRYHRIGDKGATCAGGCLLHNGRLGCFSLIGQHRLL